MSTAKIILQQLGGNMFCAMTGAKNLLSHGNALSFRLPSRFAKSGINYVKVVLNGSDLYDVEFGRVRGHSYKVVESLSDVFCGDLRSAFRRVTGLETRLF